MDLLTQLSKTSTKPFEKILRKIAAEKQIIKDKAIATSNKRRKQLLVTKEILSDAETEAMRGLKEAKLQVKKIKMTLKKERFIPLHIM